MTKYNSFSDLKVWQKSKEFLLEVFKIVENFPEGTAPEFAGAIRNAALEISSGVARGQCMYNDHENLVELTVAWKKLHQTKSLLLVAQEMKLVKEKDLEPAFNELVETQKLLGGFRRYFREKTQGKKESATSG
ncbi:MAG: four helix bundle protein [Bacteroidota bacterium]